MARLLTTLSFSLLLSAPLLGSEPLGLRDLFEIETASDPRISPDGETIVYVRRFADIHSDRYYSNLWIVNVDGTGHRPLTTGNLNRSSPRWSPSGDRLAYISTEEGSSQIWVRYTDTGQTSKLTHHEHAPGPPAWSPDGARLAFTALVPSPPPAIADLPTAPPGAQWAEPARVIDRQFYKYDPIGFLPRGDWHLFVVPAEGGTAHQVTEGDGQWGAPGFAAGTPVWSADGRTVLLPANLRPEEDNEPLDSEIYEIDVATGDVLALTDRRGPDGDVALSPDGEQIAYTGFDDRYQGYQLTHLYLADRDGTDARVLVPDLDRSVEAPRFSADGERIWFTYTSEGETRLASVGIQGGDVVDHAADIGGGVSAYAGSSGYTLASDGSFAAVLTSTGSPGDVAVGRDGGALRAVTAINADVLEHRAPSSLEEIGWESSHDGRRIQGWVLKPPGFDASRRYPLILEIHGGPFAAYGPRWDLEKEMMAAAGYVVLYTNPRGSTSYGGEFGNLIHHAYPGDDFFDLISGVDAVIAEGYVDPDRLYVTGGSGGGVLTSWVIGRSDRFRAAVTVYPVINWYSWVLSADITAFGYRYWFPALPWEDPEHYESRSLLSVVGNVETPTMVLTGEADYRTPMSESEQYYGALKLLGVESVLVRVPDESHGIRRRPSHWMQKIGHIIGWMDRFDEESGSAAPTAGGG